MGVAVPAGLSVALLFDLLAWCIVAALLVIWRQTFGAMLLYLADALHFTVNTHLGYKHTFDFGHWFRVAENAIDVWLQVEKTGLGIEIALTWHALAESWHATVRMLQWAVDETGAAFDRLESIKLPAWAKWAAAAALPAGFFAKLVAAVVARIHPVINKGTTIIEKTFPTKVVQIVRRSEAVALPSPWAFPRFRRSWRELEAWRHLTGLRIRKLEGLLAASGLALAVANMTGTTFRCWRPGGNIRRALRHVCGTPKWLLDLLIVGAVEAFIVTDLCLFSDLLMKQAEQLRPALLELVDVEDALIGCHGTSKPMVFDLPAARLPPLQGVSPLAA